MKIKTYTYPDCRSMVSANELIRSTHTFYTRTLSGLQNSESLWVSENIRITDGLEVLMDVDGYYEDKFRLRDREMSFGEYPQNATYETIELELTQFSGYSIKYQCKCILKEYTCKIKDYESWKEKLDIYDVWKVMDLEEEHGL